MDNKTKSLILLRIRLLVSILFSDDSIYSDQDIKHPTIQVDLSTIYRTKHT